MKTLNKYLQESLLDDFDKLNTNSDKNVANSIIKKLIKKFNYDYSDPSYNYPHDCNGNKIEVGDILMNTGPIMFGVVLSIRKDKEDYFVSLDGEFHDKLEKGSEYFRYDECLKIPSVKILQELLK